MSLVDLTLDDDVAQRVSTNGFQRGAGKHFRNQIVLLSVRDFEREEAEEQLWQYRAARVPLTGTEDLMNILPSPKRRRASKPVICNDYEYTGKLDGDEDQPQVEPDGQPPKPRKRGSKLSEEEKAARAAQKPADNQAKKLQKETEKQEKRAQRERDKQRKQELQAAEKAEKRRGKQEERRLAGKLAEKEVRVRMDPCLITGPGGHEYLKANVGSADEPGHLDQTERLALGPEFRSVQWQRSSTGSASAAECTPAHLTDIPYVVAVLTAEQLVREAERDGLSGLVQRAAQGLPGFTLCILVEGLDFYLKQRERADFRAAGPSGGGFNKGVTERVMAALPIRWPGVRYRLVHDAAAGAEHVAVLTKVLANQPYVNQNAFLSNFSNNAKDKSKVLDQHPLQHPDQKVLLNALLHVPELGASMAQPIAAEYKSLGNLMRLLNDPYRSSAVQRQIQDTTRAGLTRKIGPAAVTKLTSIFATDDPGAFISEYKMP